jgi:hypothetical protein
MRVAFCGASGSGKTTLAQYISDTYAVPLNPVGSRSTATRLGFKSPYDVDKASWAVYHNRLHDGCPRDICATAAVGEFLGGEKTMRAKFQALLQADKIEWETRHDDFVTDRSTVDDWAYLCLHDVHAVTAAHTIAAEAHLKRYDLIFFTPMQAFFNPDNDPKRVQEKPYHDVFETLCDGALVNWLGNDWNEKVVVMHDAELGKRKAAVRHYIDIIPRLKELQ